MCNKIELIELNEKEAWDSPFKEMTKGKLYSTAVADLVQTNK